MNGYARSQRRWLGAIAVVVGVGAIVGAQTASADTTPTQTATVSLGDLDEPGSGTFDAFDPSLGTLTQVDITAETAMHFDVCLHNRSSESDSVPSGQATGDAPIVFPADVVSNATGSMGIPATDLAASDGGDDCTAWLEGGPEPSSADSSLFSETDVSPFSETLTDPADLAEYIGPGTVPFTYSASSASSIGEPSEWTIVFLADGTADVSITYTYDPAGGTTTTTGPVTTTTGPCVPPTTTTSTTTPGQTTIPGATTTTAVDPCATTTVPGTLPTTGGGGNSAPMLAVAGILLAVGSGLVYTTRRRGL